MSQKTVLLNVIMLFFLGEGISSVEVKDSRAKDTASKSAFRKFHLILSRFADTLLSISMTSCYFSVSGESVKEHCNKGDFW